MTAATWGCCSALRRPGELLTRGDVCHVHADRAPRGAGDVAGPQSRQARPSRTQNRARDVLPVRRTAEPVALSGGQKASPPEPECLDRNAGWAPAYLACLSPSCLNRPAQRTDFFHGLSRSKRFEDSIETGEMES